MSRTTRKNFTGAKSVDSSCRNHGDCEYCRSNRLHKHRRSKAKGTNEEQDNDHEKIRYYKNAKALNRAVTSSDSGAGEPEE